jgi:hypothetical protein
MRLQRASNLQPHPFKQISPPVVVWLSFQEQTKDEDAPTNIKAGVQIISKQAAARKRSRLFYSG